MNAVHAKLNDMRVQDPNLAVPVVHQESVATVARTFRDISLEPIAHNPVNGLCNLSLSPCGASCQPSRHQCPSSTPYKCQHDMEYLRGEVEQLHIVLPDGQMPRDRYGNGNGVTRKLQSAGFFEKFLGSLCESFMRF